LASVLQIGATWSVRSRRRELAWWRLPFISVDLDDLYAEDNRLQAEYERLIRAAAASQQTAP